VRLFHSRLMPTLGLRSVSSREPNLLICRVSRRAPDPIKSVDHYSLPGECKTEGTGGSLTY
jgi:hypothetical protein